MEVLRTVEDSDTLYHQDTEESQDGDRVCKADLNYKQYGVIARQISREEKLEETFDSYLFSNSFALPVIEAQNNEDSFSLLLT